MLPYYTILSGREERTKGGKTKHERRRESCKVLRQSQTNMHCAAFCIFFFLKFRKVCKGTVLVYLSIYVPPFFFLLDLAWRIFFYLEEPASNMTAVRWCLVLSCLVLYLSVCLLEVGREERRRRRERWESREGAGGMGCI